MKQITNIRKSVCIMANELKKAGYSLSEAFKKAWRRVKLSMTIRAAGVTFKNRQERLQFLKRFKTEDLSVTLEREPNNRYDHSAIRIIVHIHPITMDLYSHVLPDIKADEMKKIANVF